MEIKDVTGQPRSDEDLERALEAVKLWILKEPLAMGPDAVPKVIHLIAIKDALQELLELRHQMNQGVKS